MFDTIKGILNKEPTRVGVRWYISKLSGSDTYELRLSFDGNPNTFWALRVRPFVRRSTGWIVTEGNPLKEYWDMVEIGDDYEIS